MITYEFVFFIILFFLGVIFAAVKTSENVYYFCSIIIFIFFSFVVRYSGFDADIGNYSQYLQINSSSIYYLKEPFYWLGSRMIYKYSDSALLVFVLYDIVFFVVILEVTRKLELPKYFPYAVIIFFPSVLGMQNVFRQFISSGFLLLFLSYVMVDAGYLKKGFFILLAFLTHNVAALFLPFFFLKSYKRNPPVLFFLSALMIIILLPLVAGTKSDSVTGELPPYLYSLILSIVIFMYLCVLKFRLKLFSTEYACYYWIMLYSFLLVFLAMFILGEAQAKRIGLLSMVIVLIPLAKIIELRFKNKILVRIIFLFVLVSPTLIFSNARSLLFTNEATLATEASARSQKDQ